MDGILSPGDTILITGPPMAPMDNVLCNIAQNNAEPTLVAAASGPKSVQRCVDDAADMAIIDATTNSGEVGGADIENVSGPSDLTGIGIKISNTTEDVNTPFVGVMDLNTLFLYSDFERVFRFVHILSSRISSKGGISAFVMSDATSDDVVSQVMTLVNRVVHVDENGNISVDGL